MTNVIKITGNNNKANINSTDNSINVTGDFVTDLGNLKKLIDQYYIGTDKTKIIESVKAIEQSYNEEPHNKPKLREQLGWLLTKTSEVAQISSFILPLLSNIH